MNFDVTTKEFELSRAAYVRFALSVTGLRNGLTVLFSVVFGAILLNASEPGSFFSGFGWFLSIYGPIFLLQQIVLYRRTYYSDQNRMLFEPARMQFTASGLTLLGEQGSSMYFPWTYVQSAYRQRDLWVFRMARISYMLLPDSAFESDGDLRAVSGFLQSRYPQHDPDSSPEETTI